jgi:CheY-like chemotaxis protein
MGQWHLLVIEDEAGPGPLLREFFRESRLEAEAHVRHTIAEVLHFLHQSRGPAIHPRPDAILIDTTVAGRATLDLLRHIKAHPSWRAIPVVAFANFLDPGERGEFLGAGAMHYWRKPAEWAEYAALLPKLLRLLGAPPVPAPPEPTSVRRPSSRRRRLIGSWATGEDDTRATSVIRRRG